MEVVFLAPKPKWPRRGSKSFWTLARAPAPAQQVLGVSGQSAWKPWIFYPNREREGERPQASTFAIHHGHGPSQASGAAHIAASRHAPILPELVLCVVFRLDMQRSAVDGYSLNTPWCCHQKATNRVQNLNSLSPVREKSTMQRYRSGRKLKCWL